MIQYLGYHLRAIQQDIQTIEHIPAQDDFLSGVTYDFYRRKSAISNPKIDGVQAG